MLSLSQLSSVVTRSEVAAWLIARLQAYGYQTTGWQPGRIQLSMLNAVSSAGAAFSGVANTLASAAFNSTSSGALLTEYSLSRFDNSRSEAAPTAGPMKFLNSSSSPHSVGVGAIVVANSAGVRFTNSESGTIPAGLGLTLDMIATVSGASGNIANESDLTLVTSLAGVTVTNPALPSGVWYTTVGRDVELDSEIRKRNSSKWGLLAVEKTSTAYINLALNQDGVAKARVVATNPRGAGTVDVYVAAASALVSTPEISAVQAAFADYTMGTESTWPATDAGPFPSTVRIYHADTTELVITGSVYYDPQASSSEIEVSLIQRLDALVIATPIGGNDYSSEVKNRLTLGDILEIVEGTRGVRSATLTAPLGDVLVPSTALVVAPGDWITGRIAFVPALS